MCLKRVFFPTSEYVATSATGRFISAASPPKRMRSSPPHKKAALPSGWVAFDALKFPNRCCASNRQHRRKGLAGSDPIASDATTTPDERLSSPTTCWPRNLPALAYLPS